MLIIINVLLNSVLFLFYLSNFSIKFCTLQISVILTEFSVSFRYISLRIGSERGEGDRTIHAIIFRRLLISLNSNFPVHHTGALWITLWQQMWTLRGERGLWFNNWWLQQRLSTQVFRVKVQDDVPGNMRRWRELFSIYRFLRKWLPVRLHRVTVWTNHNITTTVTCTRQIASFWT